MDITERKTNENQYGRSGKKIAKYSMIFTSLREPKYFPMKITRNR
jgi:hypothetical protein